MESVDKTLLTFAGVIAALAIGVVAVLVGVYQMVESSESEMRAEMQRIEAERKADEAELRAELRAEMQRIEASLRAEMAALSAKLDLFIERVDSRLDEIEREQARLSAVNELLAQQIQR